MRHPQPAAGQESVEALLSLLSQASHLLSRALIQQLHLWCLAATAALLPLQVRFNQSIFQTPELMQNIEIPSYVNVLGTPLDLTGVKVSSHAEWAALRQTSCDLLSGEWQWHLPQKCVCSPGMLAAWEEAC